MRIETPQTRYHELSEMLSGVNLYEHRPNHCLGDFYDLTRDNRFCGRWTPQEISQLLADTGCVSHWESLGFADLRIEIGHDFDNQYELSVWTRFQDADERLLYLIVWLEYIEIERLSASYPAFCVEHLRLQLPGKSFTQTPMPGQDYASSGLLRRVFGMIKLWATQTGAALITEEGKPSRPEAAVPPPRAPTQQDASHGTASWKQLLERFQPRACGLQPQLLW